MEQVSVRQTRLYDLPESERAQAVLRFVLIGLIAVITWGRDGLHSEQTHNVLLVGLAIWLIVAIVIFVSIRMQPATHTARRIAGMLVDVAGITFALFLAGGAGATFVGFYLLVIFTNGVRYGLVTLLICDVLCMVGFAGVALTAAWWQNEHEVVSGWMLAMLLVPTMAFLVLPRSQRRHDVAPEELRRVESVV